MTKISDRAQAHEAHMDRVRAVHRRSAFERVLNRIAALQGSDSEFAQEQLKHCIELRDMIRKELIEHGQLEA